MLTKAILSTIVYIIVGLDEGMFGLNMMARPIVICPVIGAIYGDLHAGILIGASLELMFMGIVDIGAATPPDVKSGSVLGTALAIMTGKGPEVALMLAVPLSFLIQSYQVLRCSLNSYCIKKGEEYALKGDTKKMGVWHIWAPLVFCIPPCILVFISLWAGVDILNSIVDLLPNYVIKSLEIAGGLLPAVGFAMLIEMMWTKKLAPFFFIGFILATYFKLDVIGVGVVAVLIALIIYNFGKDENKSDFDDEEVF